MPVAITTLQASAKITSMRCSSGGVYVPYVYSHARWVTIGDSGVCVCVLCFEHKVTPLLVDSVSSVSSYQVQWSLPYFKGSVIGKRKVVLFLLKREKKSCTSPFEKEKKSCTSPFEKGKEKLFFSFWKGKRKVVLLLLKRGKKSCTSPFEKGKEKLYFSFWKGERKVVLLLLKRERKVVLLLLKSCASPLEDLRTVYNDLCQTVVYRSVSVCCRYLKYLTKKYLKKNNLRDWLRVVASSKESFELRYFQINQDEEEEEADD